MGQHGTSRGRFIAAVVTLALISTLIATPAGRANHNAQRGVVGGFEIDGDFLYPSDPALEGGTRDWETVGGVARDDDPPETAGADDLFGKGSKEQEPDNWIYTTGKPPGKDDLTRTYFASEVTGDAIYVWLGFERLAIQGQGDAHANFEFNQKSTSIVNSKGTTIPERSDDDLLVVYDYAGGNNPVNLEVRKWDGIPDDPTTDRNEEALFGSWVDSGLGANQFFADINGSPVDRPAAAPFGGGTVATKRFGEVGLNLSSILDPTTLGCPGFSQLTVKTRSSGESFNSALKDKSGPNSIGLGDCATKNWEFTFDPQPIAGATVHAVYSVQGGEGRTLELTDADGDGTFTAVDDAIPAGGVTYHFEVRNADGDLIWRSDHNAGEDGDQDGTETFAAGDPPRTNTGHLAYDVTLTPNTAENFADEPHLFTARVFEADTDKPLPNVTVDFATFGATPDGCGSLSPTSGETDVDGEVTTTLSSATACTTSLRAFVNGTTTDSTTGFDAGEAADASTKAFVAYAVTVTPATAVNEADDPHTFTVTVTRDDGSGAAALAGAVVDLSLDAGGTDAHFTHINGVETTDTVSSTCTTDENGQCTATVVASEPGETTLTATYEATDGEGTTREITSSGIKRYVDASISVSPGEAVNEVGAAHIFTVTFTASPDGTGTPTGWAITPTVTPEPDQVDDDCDAPTVNGNTATCTVTVNHATAGVFTVDATGSVTMGDLTVTRSTSGDSGPAGTGGGLKRFVDAAVSIDPQQAINQVGDAHVFTITATAYPSGSTTTSYTIVPTVSPEPTSQSTTCAEPVVSADGNTATCTVTINSATPGVFTVNATATVVMGGESVTRSTSGTSGPGGSGPATKSYVKVTLDKTACPTTSAPPGTPVVYNLSFSIEGTTNLTNATLVDTLPEHIVFSSATPIAGVTPTHSEGVVTWTFLTLAPGDYTGSIQASVAADAPLGEAQVNTVVLDADEITPQTDTHSLLVSDAGKDADGRAYGVRVDLLSDGLLLGDPDIAPTPDSDVDNPDDLLSVPDPFGSTTPLATLLHVQETDQSSAGTAAYSALAKAAALNLDLLGGISADTVVASSSSHATATGAGSSSGGSVVQNLVVDGVAYGDVSEPMTIRVRAPITNTLLGEVRVLEKLPSGAAAGGAQPNGDNEFASGLKVNAIHVVVHDLALTPLVDEASDIIVSHAESSAEYPAGLACGEGTPTVSGLGYALDVFNLVPDLADARVAEVVLPVLGGDESATLADVVLPAGLGFSRSAFTSTTGEITDGADANSTDVEAHTLAQVEGLDLLAGLVSATLVRATSDSVVGATDETASTGNTVIADLRIAGIDVCMALVLAATCSPAPNRVLLGIPDTVVVLNEQIPTTGGLTVNAVHIFVVGKSNPLNLPVGAEIIISSAHSDAHPPPAPSS